jgi:hypothetical protein
MVFGLSLSLPLRYSKSLPYSRSIAKLIMRLITFSPTISKTFVFHLFQKPFETQKQKIKNTHISPNKIKEASVMTSTIFPTMLSNNLSKIYQKETKKSNQAHVHKTSLSKAQIASKKNIEKRFRGSLRQPHCQKHKKGVLLK